MRGGKRKGAGRKRGPVKKSLHATVLEPTLKKLNQLASMRTSIGEVIDDLVAGKKLK